MPTPTTTGPNGTGTFTGSGTEMNSSGGTTGNETFLSPFNDTVQSAVNTLPEQFIASLLALLLLAAAAWAVRTVGPWLKGRIDGGVVESMQAGVMTVVTALVGIFLISVWGAEQMITQAVQTAKIDQESIIAIVLTGAVLAGAYSLTRVSKNFIVRLSRERTAISTHHQEVAHHVTQIAIYILAGLVVLGLWGVEPESLLVGGAVATVFLGLAARQTLGAVLAGFVVLFSRPFELGDWVVVDEIEGVVTDITVVNTQIRTFDEEYVMIPNDVVTSSEIVNRSRKGRLRLETDVGVDYGTDVEEASRVATEAMREVDVVMEKPDPHVVLSEFGSSSVMLRMRYYIDNPSARKMWKARTEVIGRVKSAFEAEGVKIPFPQRELSGRPERGGVRVVGADDPSPDDTESKASPDTEEEEES